MIQPYVVTAPDGGMLSGYYRPGAPVIVLIHGFPEKSTLWEKVFPALEDASLGILAPDLPGVGNTTGGPSTLESFAQSVLAAMDAHGIEKAVVAGHSMGGYTALALAQDAPQRVQGLVLVHSTPAADNEEKLQMRQRAIGIMQSGRVGDFLKEAIPPMFGQKTKEQHPEMVEDFLQRARQQNTESLIRFYKAIAARPDRTNMLKAADFSTAAVLGADDGIIPLETGKGALAKAGVSAVSVYEQSGHLSMLEEPQRLSGDLIRFARTAAGS